MHYGAQAKQISSRKMHSAGERGGNFSAIAPTGRMSLTSLQCVAYGVLVLHRKPLAIGAIESKSVTRASTDRI